MKVLKKEIFFYLTVSLEMLTIGLWGCATQNAPMGSLTKNEYKKLHEKQMAIESAKATPIKQLPEMTDEDHERLGDDYFFHNKLEMAFLQYEKALRLNPNDIQIVYKKGLVFLVKGMNKEAIKEFQEVLKKMPDHVLAHEGLSEALFKIGRFEEAEKQLQQALKIDSKRWRAHNFRGIIYNYRKQYEKAIDEFRAAITLEPGEGLLYNNLGISYSLMGKYEEAVLVFQEALKTKATHGKIYNNLGVALGKLGRYQEALEAFKRGGDEAQAYNNLGCMYFQQGEYYKAILNFQKAMDIKNTYYINAANNLERAKKALLKQTSSDSHIQSSPSIGPNFDIRLIIE